MKSNYDYILFDLDGTLSKSAEGIKATIEYTLKNMDKPIPRLDDYSLYIGPPLVHTFRNLCKLSEEDTAVGTEIYRQRYNSVGKLMNSVFDGINELLSNLKQTGAKLAVCSSKYEPFTRDVVDIIGVSEYFSAVCGSDLNGSRKEKSELIPYAVQALGGKMTDKIVMIGDTKYDAIGATQTGVDFIGVTYGYGDIAEMKQTGAEKLAESPLALLDFLIAKAE